MGSSSRENHRQEGRPAAPARDWAGWLPPAALVLPWLAWDPASLYPHFEIKSLLWSLGGLLAAAFWAARKGEPRRITWLDAAWLAWLGVSALSLLLLPDPRIGLPDLALRLSCALAYPLFRWFPGPSDKLTERFCATALAAAELQAVAVTVQWGRALAAGGRAWDNAPLDGTLGYHNFVAAFVVTCLPLAGVLFPGASRRGRWLLAAVGLHCAAALVLLQSRAAWAGLALALLLTLWRLWPHVPSLRPAAKAGLAGGLLLLAAAMALVVGLTGEKPGGILWRTQVDLRGEHIMGRRLVWMTAAEMLRERPALGTGLGGFNFGYIPHQGAALRGVPIDRYLPIGEVVTWAHNEYLQEFLETGPAGFVLLLSLLAGAAATGFRRANGDPAAWWLATALSVMGALALVDSPLHRPSEAVLAFCLMGLLARSGGKQAGRATVSSRGIAASCAALFALAAALAVMHWMSLRLLNAAYTAPERASPATLTRLFERSLGLSLRPGQVQASWGAQLCKNGEMERGISMIEEGLGTYRDAVIYEYLGRVCAESGDLDRAATAYQSALDSGLNYAQNAAALSRVEFMQGKSESALARLNEARAVFPRNTDIALALAEYFYATGDFSRCLEALAPVAKRGDPEIARLSTAAQEALKRASSEDAGRGQIAPAP